MISMQVYNAARNEEASALFFPAISNAVPWSGEVRTIGSPAVKFTPSPLDNDLKGINAYIYEFLSSINQDNFKKLCLAIKRRYIELVGHDRHISGYN